MENNKIWIVYAVYTTLTVDDEPVYNCTVHSAHKTLEGVRIDLLNNRVKFTNDQWVEMAAKAEAEGYMGLQLDADETTSIDEERIIDYRIYVDRMDLED